MDYTNFEQMIGYTFNNKDLLKKALTHSSYANEYNVESYERLEYLGDSILEFVSSEILFKEYKKLSEGQMTKIRSTAVCEDSLYEVAMKYEIEKVALFGKSELSMPGSKKAILADMVEAIIAAIYLDSDIDQAKKFIETFIRELIEEASKHVGEKDYKTVLQEILQKDGVVKIKYEITNETGPDHAKNFTAEVFCNDRFLAQGEGNSKKRAEMDAAKHAIDNL